METISAPCFVNELPRSVCGSDIIPHGATLHAPLLVTRGLDGGAQTVWPLQWVEKEAVGKTHWQVFWTCITRSGSTRKQVARGGLAGVDGETLEPIVKLTRY